MACYHPLKAFPIGFTKANKIKYRITPYDIDYVSAPVGSDKWINYKGIPSFIPNYHTVSDYIEIPCGKCIGCRLKRSADWANRCILEAKQYDKNCFITLTVNDDNLDKVFPKYEGSSINSLSKRQMQLFMKRLRKRFPDNTIRFFGCGEYGELNQRPHMHIILFNFDFPDKVFLKKNLLGNNYYTSDILSDLWPFGFHIIGDCDWNSCAYTARYVCKKQFGEGAEIYKTLNYEPEFVLMSRKPGIARNYFDSNADEIYRADEIILSLPNGKKVVKPPRYFDKLYDILSPDDFLMVHDNRYEKSVISRDIADSKNSKPYLERLADSEESHIKRTKILKRNLERS